MIYPVLLFDNSELCERDSCLKDPPCQSIKISDVYNANVTFLFELRGGLEQIRYVKHTQAGHENIHDEVTNGLLGLP